MGYVCVCVAAPYVKVYLMDNGKCLLKRRTRLARKTLDPLYQQQLQFEENPEGKVLQVIIYVLILQDARQLDILQLEDYRTLGSGPAALLLLLQPLHKEAEAAFSSYYVLFE